MGRTRIILADDHILLSDTIKNLIEPEFEVIGMFTDGYSLVEATQKLLPDIVLLDIGMPIMNGLNAGQQIKHLLPRTKLIFLTMNQDPQLAAEAFRLGASGYVLKTSAATELVHAIREVLRGRYNVTPQITKDMVGPLINNLKNQ